MPKLLDHYRDRIQLREINGSTRATLFPVYEFYTPTGIYLGIVRFEVNDDHNPRYTALPLANPQFRHDFTSLEAALTYMCERAGIACDYDALEVIK